MDNFNLGIGISVETKVAKKALEDTAKTILGLSDSADKMAENLDKSMKSAVDSVKDTTKAIEKEASKLTPLQQRMQGGLGSVGFGLRPLSTVKFGGRDIKVQKNNTEENLNEIMMGMVEVPKKMEEVVDKTKDTIIEGFQKAMHIGNDFYFKRAMTVRGTDRTMRNLDRGSIDYTKLMPRIAVLESTEEKMAKIQDQMFSIMQNVDKWERKEKTMPLAEEGRKEIEKLTRQYSILKTELDTGRDIREQTYSKLFSASRFWSPVGSSASVSTPPKNKLINGEFTYEDLYDTPPAPASVSSGTNSFAESMKQAVEKAVAGVRDRFAEKRALREKEEQENLLKAEKQREEFLTKFQSSYSAGRLSNQFLLDQQIRNNALTNIGVKNPTLEVWKSIATHVKDIATNKLTTIVKNTSEKAKNAFKNGVKALPNADFGRGLPAIFGLLAIAGGMYSKGVLESKLAGVQEIMQREEYNRRGIATKNKNGSPKRRIYAPPEEDSIEKLQMNIRDSFYKSIALQGVAKNLVDIKQKIIGILKQVTPEMINRWAKIFADALNMVLSKVTILIDAGAKIMKGIDDFIKKNPTIAGGMSKLLVTLLGMSAGATAFFLSLAKVNMILAIFGKETISVTRMGILGFAKYAFAMYLLYRVVKKNSKNISKEFDRMALVAKSALTWILGGKISLDDYKRLQEEGLEPIVLSLVRIEKLAESAFAGLIDGAIKAADKIFEVVGFIQDLVKEEDDAWTSMNNKSDFGGVWERGKADEMKKNTKEIASNIAEWGLLAWGAHKAFVAINSFLQIQFVKELMSVTSDLAKIFGAKLLVLGKAIGAFFMGLSGWWIAAITVALIILLNVVIPNWDKICDYCKTKWEEFTRWLGWDSTKSAWDNIKSIGERCATALKDAFSHILDGFFNSLKIIPDKIDEAINNLKSRGIKLWTENPNAKPHAKGGIAKGWSIVGEEGPELVNFSNPARVYTADQTREALNGGSNVTFEQGSVVINVASTSDTDLNEVADKLMRIMARKMQLNNMAVRT